MRADSLPPSYRPWLIASVAVLVASLALLAAAVTAAFISFAQVGTPLWVVVVGVVAVLGIGLGFGGLVVLVAIAGWKSFREARRVQIISPRHEDAG